MKGAINGKIGLQTPLIPFPAVGDPRYASSRFAQLDLVGQAMAAAASVQAFLDPSRSDSKHALHFSDASAVRREPDRRFYSLRCM